MRITIPQSRATRIWVRPVWHPGCSYFRSQPLFPLPPVPTCTLTIGTVYWHRHATKCQAPLWWLLHLPSSLPCNELTGDSYMLWASVSPLFPAFHYATTLSRPSPAPPGWLDDEPARVTSRMEIRPAAELGPIILCLDTSGSMRGARETVAKALALECLRGAHRQRRPAYLYAFSGPSAFVHMYVTMETDTPRLPHLSVFLLNYCVNRCH